MTTTEDKTDKEIIFSYKNGDILWRIYGLESTWGKNDGCKIKGLSNGFGFGKDCYLIFEDVVNKVNNWFEEKMKKYTLAESLCGYNLGFNSVYINSCIMQSEHYPYYKKYLTIY